MHFTPHSLYTSPLFNLVHINKVGSRLHQLPSFTVALALNNKVCPCPYSPSLSTTKIDPCPHSALLFNNKNWPLSSLTLVLNNKICLCPHTPSLFNNKNWPLPSPTLTLNNKVGPCPRSLSPSTIKWTTTLTIEICSRHHIVAVLDLPRVTKGVLSRTFGKKLQSKYTVDGVS